MEYSISIRFECTYSARARVCVFVHVCPTCIRIWCDTDRYCEALRSNRIEEREFRPEPHYRFVTARVHKTVDGRPGGWGRTTIWLNLSPTGNTAPDLNRFRTIRLWPTQTLFEIARRKSAVRGPRSRRWLVEHTPPAATRKCGLAELIGTATVRNRIVRPPPPHNSEPATR